MSERLESGGGCWCRCGKPDCGVTLRAELEGLRAQVAGLEKERGEAIYRLIKAWGGHNDPITLRGLVDGIGAELAELRKELARETDFKQRAYRREDTAWQLLADLCDEQYDSVALSARLAAARAALSAYRAPEDAPKDAVLHNSCADEETK